MAHIGFTPQSEHTLGGYRVQGRGDAAATVVEEALAIEAAGAFAVVMEMVPGDVAAEVTKARLDPHHRHRRRRGLRRPGAGLAGRLRAAHRPDGEVRQAVRRPARRSSCDAAREYADDVKAGTFPGPDHTLLSAAQAPLSGDPASRYAWRACAACSPASRSPCSQRRGSAAHVAPSPAPRRRPRPPRRHRQRRPGPAPPTPARPGGRAAAVPALDVRRQVTGLDHPWDVQPIGDGRC